MSTQVYDPIRKTFVKADPEERVRQKLLKRLIEELSFPKELISIECSLSSLPHLSESKKLPLRRCDILCFAKGIHPKHTLYPLLLIECKASSYNEKAKRQLIGYNYYLQAPFISLASQKNECIGYLSEMGEYEFISHIPTYQQLIDAVKFS